MMGTETKKTRKSHWRIARHTVQVLALVLFSAPILIAGWGLAGIYDRADEQVATVAELPFFGSLSSSSIANVTLLDPFAALQVICASKTIELDWLLALLPVVIVYGLVRGRAFCGWVCPVNLMLEIVDFLRRKLKITVREAPIPRHAKLYVAAAVLVLSAVTSVPVFEAISPISAIQKGLLLGSMTGLITLAAIIVAELFWGHRVWCRSLCPLGGFYEAIGRAGLVNVRIDHDACVHCNRCKAACLCDPAILEPALSGADVIVRAGDCMACGTCVDACPTRALKLRIGKPGKPKAGQDSTSQDS